MQRWRCLPPAVLEDVAFAFGNDSNELSSPVKLGAGLASLAPIRVSTDCGGVVGPVEPTTIEVQDTDQSEHLKKIFECECCFHVGLCPPHGQKSMLERLAAAPKQCFP